ncbi:MAG TPA: phytanoyl-CoA dioxygenase family protein [Ktedonobacteraceae bacterium]
MRTLNVLTETQSEQFIEEGYTRLEEAFPRQQALLAQAFLWERLAERGIRRDDRSTWQEPMVRINETYDDAVFQACATPRLVGAIEDLVGQGRYVEAQKSTCWGWWPVNFALGSQQPWDVPTTGWHWDGNYFRHFVDSPEQGLLLLCLFSETQPYGGGTTVATGSHKIVARFLNQYAAGLELRPAIELCNRSHPWLETLTGSTGALVEHRVEYFMENPYQDGSKTTLRVVETTGLPGDIFLCHPFLYHSSSQNHSGIPRFMCNRTTPLTERMQTQRDDGNYSPLEISIRRALLA